mgnify:FL=1
MLDKLKNRYKEAFTSTYHPNSSDYRWFQTEQNEIFGIHRSFLTDEEEKLLSALFQPYPIDQQKGNRSKWFHFIFEQKPLEETIRTVRFYYFFTNQKIEEKDIFKEAFQGIIHSFSIVWLSDQHGWLIHENDKEPVSSEALAQIAETVGADFMTDIAIFIGQLHRVNAKLPRLIQNEIALIELYKNIFDGGNKAFTFSELLILQFIHKKQKIHPKEFLSDYILEAFQDGELMKTIKVFIESNLNVTKTAKKLFMHRNSVQYRIDKFIEWTGIDVRQFCDAVAVYLLIRLYEH